MNNNCKNPILKNLAIVGTVLTFLTLQLILAVQMSEIRESIGEMRAEMRGEFARVDAEMTAMRSDIDDLKNDSREIRNLLVTHIVGHDHQKTAAPKQ